LPDATTLDDVIIEYAPQGAYVRVSAFDPRTLTEVSIVGAASAGHAILERMVLRKLDWVMARKRG
jgi:hypothetical protein